MRVRALGGLYRPRGVRSGMMSSWRGYRSPEKHPLDQVLGDVQDRGSVLINQT